MVKNNQKKQYLTPAVKTVAFKVEQGFANSPDQVLTFNPTAGPNTSRYQNLDDTDNGAFKNDFQFINQ